MTRAEQPRDQIVRDEIAFQLRIARHEPRVVTVIRDLARAWKAAEDRAVTDVLMEVR